MMLDERVVQALSQIIGTARTHQRACLIGGQALRDLYDALCVRIGADIPAVRTSQDLDLLITIGWDVEADRSLAAVLREFWRPKEDRPATYVWRADPEIELDLATIYEGDEEPARAIKISHGGTGRIMAYKMIPAWLHHLNLMEPCHGTRLKQVGLERLRHTALVVSKLLAVDACLLALDATDPPERTTRLDRDLEDVLYLTDRRLQPGLWCAASSAKRAELHRHLDPILDRVSMRLGRSPDGIKAETLERLRMVIDGLPLWWR